MDNITNLQLNNEVEERVERSLRPKTFQEVIGKKVEVESLKVMIAAAQKRGDALDHILFHGPPGLGKTSFSQIVANEMNVPIHVTSGPAIERQGDLASILTNIEDRGILFIDEIHRLNRVVEEVLYPAMEDRAIDILIGKGPSAKTLRLDLNKFTLIGATTKVGRISSPLRDRFGAIFRFDFYSHDEISEIIKQKAKLLDISVDENCMHSVAIRARKTPRIAIRILKRIRDYADVKNNGYVTDKEVEQALSVMDIDYLGLDYVDRRILKTIVENFNNHPVGVSTIAASIGEEEDTIEDVYEPYLLQEGLLQRTPRGRIVTPRGIEHVFGKEYIFNN